MPDITQLQEELKKITESIKALELLRGRVSDAEINRTMSFYQQQLEQVTAQLNGQASAPVKVRRERIEQAQQSESLESNARIVVNPQALNDASEIYLSTQTQPPGFGESHKNRQLSRDDLRSFLGHYLRWVAVSYTPARLYGLEVVHEEGGRLVRAIQDVFAHPAFFALDTNRLAEFEMASAQARSKAARVRIYMNYLAKELLFKNRMDALPFPGLLTTGQRIAILGPFGSGKSTILAYLASSLAVNAQTGRMMAFSLPGEKETLIPAVIPFRDFWRYQAICEERPVLSNGAGRKSWINVDDSASQGKAAPQNMHEPYPGTLIGYIIWYLKSCTPALADSSDMFERLISGGGCLLMLDGLDEVRSAEKRHDINYQLQDLYRFFPNAQILMTASDAGCIEDVIIEGDVTRLYIQPLRQDQVEKVVGNWCRLINPRKANALSEDVLAVVENINRYCLESRYTPLVDTPLMACLMLSTRLSSAEWPLDRSRLYESLVKILLQMSLLPSDIQRKETVEWEGSWENYRDWFSQLALDMHKNDEAGSSLQEGDLRQILRRIAADEMVEKILVFARVRKGLFEERNNIFHFLHPFFQSYLVARMLANQPESVQEGTDARVSSVWWRETFLLSFDLLNSRSPAAAQQYLTWLTTLQIDGLELAGAIVLKQDPPQPAMRHELAVHLAEMLMDRNGNARPDQRSRAGDTLGMLGDPRFRKDAYFLPDDPMLGFLKVPAGPYLIGSSPDKDPETNTKEIPMHEVGLLEYFIGRFPVTVAQFRTFVQNTGYKPINARSLDGLPNHPVTNVTWDEARLYCQWLQRVLTNWTETPPELLAMLQTGDWELIMPSEAEWEAAARGSHARSYPWGGRFDPRFANTEEARLGRTTAVGIFPGGTSPMRVLDQTGNVWEWTRSVYRIYYYNSGDGREDYSSRDFRVLRGGSFANPRVYARTSFRSIYYPDYKANNIGFRLALHQIYEYEEQEIEIEVPLENGEMTLDGKVTKTVRQMVMLRKPVIIAGPRQDR